MKKFLHTVNEMVEYRSDFIGRGDFSGKENSFTLPEREAFLQAYSNFCRKVNGLGEQSQKAVPQAEVERALEKINYTLAPRIRRREYLGDFSASLLAKQEEYCGWHFYTARTRLEGGAVVFDDGIAPPMPCAKYQFDGENLTRLSLRVFISSEYKKDRVGLSEKNLPQAVTTGRVIELRNGKQEIVKLQFYAIGTCCARVGVPDIYHHKNVVLGNYRFDEWNEVVIELHEKTFSVLLNGERTEGLALSAEIAPDTLFLSGGFHPRGVWKVAPKEFLFSNGAQREFFTPATTREVKEEHLGVVQIPYAVGGYENRDKYLILRKKLAKIDGKKAVLTLDTLDPGGRVLINGVRVLETDGFLRQTVDITEYLHAGENQLEIIVEPRAPEILYSWHRCQDTYMAWQCGAVTLDYLPKSYVAEIDAVTTAVTPTGADVTFTVRTVNGAGKKLKLFLAQTNPTRGEETLVYSGEGKEEQEIRLSLNVLPWSPQCPALYSVRAEIEGEDDLLIETGFRTIEQKEGAIYLNGEKILLRGALLMQFLPPYENIVKSHICPTDEEIVWQYLAIFGMNGNLARLHMLGYGTNDSRFARFADRLGLTLVWTTRLIDSVECVQWGKGWSQGGLFVEQINEVKHHPSIVIWEGSNEYRAAGNDIDWLYDEFVKYVKSADSTRLLSPCSHLYYGGGLSGEGYFYQDDGTLDADYQPAQSSFGWKDDLVVRSAHPYCITLGYGGSWQAFRSQPWKAHQELFDSKLHAYLVTEMATIGRHDHTTKECKAYVKNDSYELSEERLTIGRALTQEEWRLSQAYQALAAGKAIRFLRAKGVDGIAWCCLSGGANDASYLKPPVDFYGYAKYAYYAMKESYAERLAFNENVDVRYGKNSPIAPCVIGLREGESASVSVRLYDETDCLVAERNYASVLGNGEILRLEAWIPEIRKEGYYRLSITLEGKEF